MIVVFIVKDVTKGTIKGLSLLIIVYGNKQERYRQETEKERYYLKMFNFSFLAQ